MYFLFLMVFLMTFFPSLAYCIVRIQHIIRPIYKICVDQLFMLSVKLLSTLGYYKFWGGSKVICKVQLHGRGGWCPHPHIVQVLTVKATDSVNRPLALLGSR